MHTKTLDASLPATLALLLSLCLIACTCGQDKPSDPAKEPANDAPNAQAPAAKSQGWSIKGGVKISEVAPLGGADRRADVERLGRELYEGKKVVVRAFTCANDAKDSDVFPCTLEQAHAPSLSLIAQLQGNRIDFTPADATPASLDLDALEGAIVDKIKADTTLDSTVTCGQGVAFFAVGATFTCALTMENGLEQQVTVTAKDAEGNVSWETRVKPAGLLAPAKQAPADKGH
jgi:hypothetical protein